MILNKTILLVDDDPITNMISEKIIVRYHSAVVKAFTQARLALEYLQECSNLPGRFPDLILLDINMPHMDGWEFLSEYEKLNKDLLNRCTLVMLTSSIDFDDIKKAKSFWTVKDFISKPLTAEKVQSLFLKANEVH